MDVLEAVRLGRAFAAQQLPFFATALYGARVVITAELPALAAIDRNMVVYFNPEWVRSYVLCEGSRVASVLGFIWVHEISHCLRRHDVRFERLQGEPTIGDVTDPDLRMRWNIATDCEINDAQWPGLEPPENHQPVYPSSFGFSSGDLAESYFAKLTPQMIEKCAKFSRATLIWSNGSGVDGVAKPWEVAQEDSQSPLANWEREQIEQQLARELVQAQGRGDIPGGWIRWAAEIASPSKIDWRRQLKSCLRSAISSSSLGKADYTYRRPHRRAQAFAPAVMPSLSREVEPSVAVVLDTSGSMGEADLSRCLREVRDILQQLQLRSPIRVYPCDATPYAAVEVFSRAEVTQLARSMPGGGGTNLVAGIERAIYPASDVHGVPPSVVLCLTDGDTPYPSRRYRTPVIWGILERIEYGLPAGLPPMPPWRSDDVVMIR